MKISVFFTIYLARAISYNNQGEENRKCYNFIYKANNTRIKDIKDALKNQIFKQSSNIDKQSNDTVLPGVEQEKNIVNGRNGSSEIDFYKKVFNNPISVIDVNEDDVYLVSREKIVDERFYLQSKPA